MLNVMVKDLANSSSNRVQILNAADTFPLALKLMGKGMNSSVLSLSGDA